MGTLIGMYVLVFCRIVIGLLFAISAINKLRDFGSFAQTITRFRILPGHLSTPAACIFVAAEVIITIMMVFGGVWLWPGFLFTILLLVAFSVALGSVLARNIQTSCNCFGNTDKPVSTADIWRNLGFTLCAIGGCVALSIAGTTASSLGLIEWAMMAASATVFVVVWMHLSDIVQLVRLET
ncbi:MAG: MauE/DoxX family redox-associated membrane protein [Chloroflexota bacterium]